MDTSEEIGFFSMQRYKRTLPQGYGSVNNLLDEPVELEMLGVEVADVGSDPEERFQSTCGLNFSGGTYLAVAPEMSTSQGSHWNFEL